MIQKAPTPARRGFLSDLMDPATYLQGLYLLLAFPLGLAYFVFLVVGVSVGASLVIVWVGLPILLLVLAGVLLFADVERALASRLLGVTLRRSPRRSLTAGVWVWVREQLGNAGTWKGLLYLILKFPFGLASFVFVTVLGSVSVAFLLAPILMMNGADPLIIEGRNLTVPGVMVLPVAGVGLLVFSAVVVRGLARLWGFLALALLADTGETRRAQREVQALSRGASIIAFAGSLEETLDTLIGQALEATDARACTILQFTDGHDQESTWRVGGERGLPAGFTQELQRVYQAHAALTLDLLPGRVRILRDARRAWLHDEQYAPTHPFLHAATWDVVTSLPLLYRGERVGRLDAFFPAVGPTVRELEFLGAIADQAAVAIENARLFARVQEQASVQERQRLARELHDSVSQALYGVTLGVKTARTWLDRDPTRAAEPLEYALALAEGGTAEMKALLFALRPESLAQEGLSVALAKQAAVLSARYKLQVHTDLSGEPDVPLSVKEALYRISQEALHNTVKHARARSVIVRLRDTAGNLSLEIQDDGQGFDPRQEFPGHLGLHSMRERAEGAGGTLVLETAPGAGVRLIVRLPKPAVRA